MNKNKRQNRRGYVLYRPRRRNPRDPSRSAERHAQSEFLVAAKAFHNFLNKINAEISGAWLPLNMSRNQHDEIALMLERDAAEFHQCEARIMETHRSLDKNIQYVLDEFREILTQLN